MLTKHLFIYLLLLTLILFTTAKADEDTIKLGMIGLDTSHVIAFAEYINNPKNDTGCKIIAAYPGGSPDISASADRIEGFTAKLRDKFNIEMVDSIEKLCEMVDGILLTSVDGRPHLKQAIPVIKAKKPFFMDKPAGGCLEDIIKIYQLAEENNVPCWSSSSLRFSPGIIGMRNDKEVGKVLGCDAFGPCHLEPHHPDLYWYGIHTMEVLYTIMGTGCQTVTRVHTEGTDYAVGVWDDGRIGTFRGIRKGASPYGALVYGDKGVKRSGEYIGYQPLAKEIIKFFKTGKAPIPPQETIEMYAFMTAADISKEQNSAPVSIPELIAKTKKNSRLNITIQNKTPRIDVDGNIIDAHDGCLEFFDGKFYLYGTKYGKTDGFTQANQYVCYSSKAMMKWQFEGPMLKDPPRGVYYRPYVKYNRKTKKYVLWYNWYPKLWEGQYGVAVSDSPAGPFVIHNDNTKVKQPKPGDHGLFIDDDDNAYLIYTSIADGHGISIEKLSDDYLSSTFENSGIFAKGCEAASMFKKDQTYYALFGKCCCFCRQGSGAMVYTSKSPLGPYEFKGNINRDDNNKPIIPAQQTHIAKILTSNGPQYIWMGDLWNSRSDGIKGHDLQYWGTPLQFESNGMIKKMTCENSWTFELPKNAVKFRFIDNSEK